jgi:hypothetical protein
MDLYNAVKTLPISVSSIHEKLAKAFRPAVMPILKYMFKNKFENQ